MVADESALVMFTDPRFVVSMGPLLLKDRFSMSILFDTSVVPV